MSGALFMRISGAVLMRGDIDTPYCITVDHGTLSDGTVTIREGDTIKQERIPVEKVQEIVRERVDVNALLKQLG